MKRLKIGGLVLVCLLFNLFCFGNYSSRAFADYPTKPINLVVGFAAGGGNGLAAQLIADYFTKKWKHQVNIIYKPGGSSVPAVLDVYTAKPDGYTLLIDASSSSSIQYSILKSLPYKVEDRTFIARCIVSPSVYYVSMQRPWKTINEVGEFGRREPENLKWGSLGNAALTTLNMMITLNSMGVDVRRTKRIDMKGGPELLAAAAGGHFDFGSFGIGAAMPLIDAGKIRPVAILAPQRLKKRLPDIPTLKETGLPGGSPAFWIGLSGPPGLPKEVVDQWNQGLKEASTDQDFIDIIDKGWFVPDYVPSESFKKMVLEECTTLKEIAEKMGVTAN